jgi:hypothetical protein
MIVEFELAWDLNQAFLAARSSGTKRFRRCLDKVWALERQALKQEREFQDLRKRWER